MENNKENLEEYFSQKFNQDMEPEAWNVPGDDVWNNIESKLPKKEKRRFWAFLPFILAGLATLAAIALGLDNYNKKNKINDLQLELEKCGKNDVKAEKAIGSAVPLPESNNITTESAHQNESLTSNTTADKNEAAYNSNSASEANENKGNKSKPLTSQAAGSSIKEHSGTIERNNQSKNQYSIANATRTKKSNAPISTNITAKESRNSIVKVPQTKNSNAPISTNSTVQKNNDILSREGFTSGSTDLPATRQTPSSGSTEDANKSYSAERRTTDQMYRLPTLQSYVISKNNTLNSLLASLNNLDLKVPESSDLEHEKNEREYKIWLGALVSYNIWNDRISGKYIDPLTELLINEKTTNSISVGFAAGKQISPKIVLNGSITYYSRARTSEYEINLPYSTVDEINAGDDFENHFQHSLPTSLGDVSTELILARSKSSSVQNNENVNLNLSLNNIIKAISIPLTAQFFLQHAGKGLYFQTGIANEFIIKNEIADVSTISHHTSIHDKSISISYRAGQVRKYNMRLLAGVGYQRELKRGFSLALYANYGYALTNTFQKNEYRHKIDQMGIGLGVYKSL